MVLSISSLERVQWTLTFDPAIFMQSHLQEDCQEELEARLKELNSQEEAYQSRVNNSDSNDSIFSRLALFKPLLCRDDLDSYHSSPKALVVDNTSLQFALHPTLKNLFLNLAKRCRSVVCCRATPLQKVCHHER